MSRERKLLLAAAAFVGMIVVTLALAVDPSPTSPPTQPIGTSTTVSPPSPTTPPSSAVPVFDEPKDEKKDEKKGEKKQEGRGNGNEGNRGTATISATDV